MEKNTSVSAENISRNFSGLNCEVDPESRQAPSALAAREQPRQSAPSTSSAQEEPPRLDPLVLRGQETREMLVDEEERHEVRIAPRHQDEPGRRQRQKQRQPRAQRASAARAGIALHNGVRHERPAGEHADHDALAENRQSRGAPSRRASSVARRPERSALALRQRKREHGGGQPEGEARIEQVEMADEPEVRDSRRAARPRRPPRAGHSRRASPGEDHRQHRKPSPTVHSARVHSLTPNTE